MGISDDLVQWGSRRRNVYLSNTRCSRSSLYIRKVCVSPISKNFSFFKKSVQYILQLHLGFFSRLNNGLVVVSFTIPALIGPAHSLAIGSEDRGSRIQKVRGHLDKVEVRSESMWPPPFPHHLLSEFFLLCSVHRLIRRPWHRRSNTQRSR